MKVIRQMHFDICQTIYQFGSSRNILPLNHSILILSDIRFDEPSLLMQLGFVRCQDFVKPFSPQDIEKRSQELQVILHDSGQFYWCKTKAFLDNPNILYNHTAPFIVSETEVQDIDNQSDWELAEIKYSYMVRKNGNN